MAVTTHLKSAVVSVCALFAGAILSNVATEADAKTFRWAATGDASTQDPHGQDEGFTKSINALVYERLIQPGKDMMPVPWLATSWKVINPTTRELTLRKDVKFHDGTPFTADDVVFSFERAGKSKQYKTYTVPAGVARKSTISPCNLRLKKPTQFS